MLSWVLGILELGMLTKHDFQLSELVKSDPAFLHPIVFITSILVLRRTATNIQISLAGQHGCLSEGQLFMPYNNQKLRGYSILTLSF